MPDKRLKGVSKRQKIALLAHECSHVVYSIAEDMRDNEEMSDETRAYLLQSVMLACLDQLGDEWLN